MTPEESSLLEKLHKYMEEADQKTLSEMSHEDVKLSLFISLKKGYGRELWFIRQMRS